MSKLLIYQFNLLTMIVPTTGDFLTVFGMTYPREFGIIHPSQPRHP
ncbi:hypothetical protein [Legionella sp. WA2022007384]